MRVNTQWSIQKIDERNFTLTQHKTWGKDSKKEGEEYEETFGHYGTLEAACNRLIDLQVNTESLELILKTIKETKNEIKEAINAQ